MNYTHITGSGDDGVVYARPATLYHVVVGVAAAAETVAIHDAATVEDAAAGNLVSTVSLAAVGDWPFGVSMRSGIVAVVSGGSPDITVCWG